MLAFKAMKRDHTCTLGKGVFTYEEGKVIEDELPDGYLGVTCAHNGLHATTEPFDTLSYYRKFDENRYYLVACGGDIHEDDIGSRLCCTRMKLIKELSMEEFVLFEAQYIIENPYQEVCGIGVVSDGTTLSNYSDPFVIVRSNSPAIRMLPSIEIAVLMQENPNGTIRKVEVLKNSPAISGTIQKIGNHAAAV